MSDYTFRHAICNEVFQGWKFHDACKKIRETGYTGIEIAPFTLSETPAEIPLNDRQQYRGIMNSEGLEFIGLHWLMMAPKGLHVTTPDAAVHRKSWDHVHSMIDLCADLAGNTQTHNGIIVFGSPFQRSTTGGMSREDAVRRFRDGFAECAGHAATAGVTLLVEALPSAQSDVVNTLKEAVEIVDYCNMPSVKTMFDTHNALDETDPHDQVVDRYFDYIRHVHVNELDGKHCSRGDYDFKPLLRKLRDRNYNGWVSLEAFDFSFGSEVIAAESLRYLESEIAKL
ncbi:MAG: sugar phosphate isomerase/epimerase [Acidobacteria bacterium]|nr:sugar phosphate isomerase/epimerase [Acidobacteriota bacterium]